VLELAKLLRFMDHCGCDLNVELASVAGNLYEDMGEVAMTLINLRFKQAEALLKPSTQRSEVDIYGIFCPTCRRRVGGGGLGGSAKVNRS
jgi:hypothetical protein